MIEFCNALLLSQKHGNPVRLDVKPKILPTKIGTKLCAEFLFVGGFVGSVFGLVKQRSYVVFNGPDRRHIDQLSARFC